jgi:hypothetical protein
MMQAHLERLEAAGETELLADTRRAFELFLAFYDEKGPESRRETLGFADLATTSEDLRFGDIRATVIGLYKELAQWEDQAEAQRMRDALARFLHRPTEDRAMIPERYSTELQVVFNALRDMHWPAATTWLHGMTGIGLSIADTLMYQRGDPSPSDPDMSSLYGLAMPLVKHGVALEMVQLERAAEPGYLDDVQVLLLTYEGQKPPSVLVHQALADWVKSGNTLIVAGSGDAYDSVRAWWNEEGADYARPQAHLTELLGLGRDPAPGTYPCARGRVIVMAASPAALAHDPEGPSAVLAATEAACEAQGLPWAPTNHLVLRRGPYVVAAGMDESLDAHLSLPGTYINLYDFRLRAISDPEIKPGTRWLLYDLDQCPDHPWVIAAAGRVVDEQYDDDTLTFTLEGLADTKAVVCARVPAFPSSVTVDGEPATYHWDPDNRTARVRFPNRPEGVPVTIAWA